MEQEKSGPSSEEKKDPEQDLKPEVRSQEVTPQVAPAPEPGGIMEMITERMGFSVGPMLHPLLQKMDATHIGKLLDNQENDSARRHDENRLKNWLAFSVSAGGAVLIFALCFLFLYYNKPEHLDGIIGLVVGLVAGAVGGYGYGRGKSKND